MKSAIEQIAATMAASVFLDELSFDRNKFKPVAGKWGELADLVLYLGSHALFVQVKERGESASHDESSLRKWYKSRVINDGIQQLEDTHRFLRQNREASVKNRRGDSFSIARLADASPMFAVLYGSLSGLPDYALGPRAIQSDTLGSVQLVDVGDFRNLLRWTVTPGELLSYLDFRSTHLRAVPDHAKETEKWLFGRYIACPNVVSTVYDVDDRDFEQVVDALVDDTDTVDLRPYLSTMREMTYATVGDPSNYYNILIELGWLHRSMMREFKRRLGLCLDNTANGEVKMPYRLINVERDCVFVLIMSDTQDEDKRWQELTTLVGLAKYDTKVRRALGVLVAEVERNNIVLDWLFFEDEWRSQPEIDRALGECNPFRPLKQGMGYDYFTREA